MNTTVLANLKKVKRPLMIIYSTDLLLRVKSLCSGYGKHQVLFDVSFDVKRGEIVLLVGGNGSGKSTVLKAIYGLLGNYENKRGNIIFEDRDITECKPFQMISKGLVYVPQKNNTFDMLNVKENLEVAATHLKNKAELNMRINDVFEKLPKLASLKTRSAFSLSGGEKQQLALGMAVIQSPKMIMLDEPSAGLAPTSWKRYLEIIEELGEQGISFLIVEHMVKESILKAHDVLRMKLGRIEKVKTN